jgi:heavy metal sensor kinase
VRTIRARLTVWYSVALLAALAIFGVALYLNPPVPDAGELEKRNERDATFASQYLEESRRVLGELVVGDSTPRLVQTISAAFEGLPSALVVLGTNGEVLSANAEARKYDFATLADLLALARPIPVGQQSGTAAIGPDRRRVRWRYEPLDSAGSAVAGVLVATEPEAAPNYPQLILNAMLLVSPAVILASVALGHWLAGTALRPVQDIIDEVAAVTDGRSLNRRIVVPTGGDEMTRLAVTLNGMLARLEQSFVSLRRFTADASHELKTPLMVLRAGVERALTDPSTPGEILQTLDETLEEINRMSEMVEALLTLARADEGRAPLSLETMDLRLLMEDVAETAGILGEEAGLRVETSLPAEPVRVPVDAARIREMLLNLVTNAIKYTPAGGEVHLAVTPGPESVALVVRDTGIGIAPGDLPHIFERFWRADPARSRTGERPGVGLGLAITKWIAEAHGGSITVQSRPGRGTAFTITLPTTSDIPATGA